MRTIVLTIEYDGTPFSGWQIQPDPRRQTVQGVLEKALAEMTQEKIRVRFASRTDAGVHARGQMVAFETARDAIPPIGFERGLSNYLPSTVVVRRAEVGEDGWDPRRNSRGKRYRYTYWNDRAPTALLRDRAWWLKPGRLEAEPMHRAAQVFIGTHDFDAFRSSSCVARHAVRRMYRASVEVVAPHTIVFEIVGNAFCKNMVRIMAGTLADVGLGKIDEKDVKAVLESKDRTKAGMTAPPQGLCLEEVVYDDRLPLRPKDDVDV